MLLSRGLFKESEVAVFHDRQAQTIAEWIIIIGVMIVLAGGAVYAVYQALGDKLNDVTAQIGS